MRQRSTVTRPGVFTALVALLLFNLGSSFGQDSRPATVASIDDKAEQIVRRGLEAVGGSNYSSVRTTIGRGFFTDFKDGVSTVPGKFIDCISYPDKERTEFITSGIRTIQTNNGATGWIFDGYTKNLKDQTPTQIEEFKLTMRTSVENLLQGWWRSAGASLSYAGRREAGVGRRNETVRLTYPDGFWVEFEFAAKEGLPAKVIYKRKQKNADTEEIEEITEEDHLHKPITSEGITKPFIIDHFRNGVQTIRINYESIEFNRPLAASLFDKPATIKNLK